MNKVIVFSAIVAFALAVKFQTQKRQQCDPADSWLAYTVSKGNGNYLQKIFNFSGQKITFVNATWTVPAYPTDQSEGNAPGIL